MQFSGLENTPVFIGQVQILLLYLAASFFQVFCYWISFCAFSICVSQQQPFVFGRSFLLIAEHLRLERNF